MERSTISKRSIISSMKNISNRSSICRFLGLGRGQSPAGESFLGPTTTKKKLIRINRFLDHGDFPQYVVEFIIYHEMVHHIEPPKQGKKGRRRIHHLEFKSREQQFESYKQAKAFIKSWVKERQKTNN